MVLCVSNTLQPLFYNYYLLHDNWNTKLHKSLASWAISKLDFGKDSGKNTDKYLIQSCVSPWAMYSGWEQNAGPLRYVTVSPIPMSLLRMQSFTSKMKNNCQEINRSYIHFVGSLIMEYFLEGITLWCGFWK